MTFAKFSGLFENMLSLFVYIKTSLNALPDLRQNNMIMYLIKCPISTGSLKWKTTIPDMGNKLPDEFLKVTKSSQTLSGRPQN